MDFIKAGYGYNFGQDFARTASNLPIEIVERRGSEVFGYVNHPRYGRVKARTNWNCIETENVEASK